MGTVIEIHFKTILMSLPFFGPIFILFSLLVVSELFRPSCTSSSSLRPTIQSTTFWLNSFLICNVRVCTPSASRSSLIVEIHFAISVLFQFHFHNTLYSLFISSSPFQSFDLPGQIQSSFSQYQWFFSILLLNT